MTIGRLETTMKPGMIRRVSWMNAGIKVAWSIVLTLWAGAPQCLAAPATPDLSEIRHKSCQGLQADFDQIESHHKDQPDFAAYTNHLKDLESAAGGVLVDLARHHAQFVARSTAALATKDKMAAPVGAAAILAQFQGHLTYTPLGSAFSDAESKTLQDYYQADAKGLDVFISNYAHDRVLSGTVGDETIEIYRLCLVLPLLRVPDTAWGAQNVNDLPGWLKDPALLSNIEKALIHLDRPITAYWFRPEAQGDAGIPPADLGKKQIAYLLAAAKPVSEGKSIKDRDLPAAIACYAAAAETAHSHSFVQEERDSRLALAQTLAERKDFSAAEEQAQLVLAGAPDDSTYGRAQMLHLRFLYGMNRFSDVVSGVDQIRDDKRCQSYLPQIVFIGCMSSRQLNQPKEDQQKREKDFLDHFTDHPLAAYIYFSQAQDYLAQAKYDEAKKLFKLIDLKYPQSDVISRVRDIEQKLDASSVPGQGAH